MKKRLMTLVLVVCMAIALMPIAFAEEAQSTADPVACIGTVEYDTLADAVAAANDAGDSAEIIMLKDIELGEKLVINENKNITIMGSCTITRKSDYTGTLFEVQSGATLTLDGGLIIDGGNNWEMDKETYWDDLEAMRQVPEADRQKYFKLVTGAPIANNHVITVNSGDLNLFKVTFQNHYGIGSQIVNATGASDVVLTGAVVKHCANVSNGGLFVGIDGQGATLTMNEGTVADGNHVGGNHGVFRIYGGTLFTMNGGEIKNTTGWNSNGSAIGVYHSEFVMNDGLICSNSSVWGTNNQRNPAVYIHVDSKMTMNGGTICHNTGKDYGGGIASYQSSAVIIINGGNVVHNVSLNNDYRGGIYVDRGDDVDAPASKIEISGGTFTQDVNPWCADGFAALKHDNGEWSIEKGYQIVYHAVSKDENGEPASTVLHYEGVASQLCAQGYAPSREDENKKTQTILAWHTDPQLTNPYDFAAPVTADVLLYGEWSDVSKITFTTVPANAEVIVTLDGEVIAPGSDDPHAYMLSDGTEYEYEVSAGGYKNARGTFTTADEKIVDGVMHIELSRKKSSSSSSLSSADRNAAKAVIEMINEIGKVEPDDEVLIEEARDAYDDLTAAQKRLVSNYDELVEAEEEIEELLESAAYEWPFIDVNEDDACYESVKFVYENGLMVGVGDGTVFAPEASLSRAMTARIFYALEKEPAALLAGEFTDVIRGFWYSDAIDWATSAGVIAGYGDGSFGPNDAVTREQLAVMLYQFAKGKGYDVTLGDALDHPDAVFVSDWARDAMTWAINRGILTENGVGYLAATDIATRADVAAAFTTFLNLYE